MTPTQNPHTATRDAHDLMKRLSELAVQRTDLEIQAMRLDKEAVLSPFTDGGEAEELALKLEARSLRDKAQGLREEALRIVFEYPGPVDELVAAAMEGTQK